MDWAVARDTLMPVANMAATMTRKLDFIKQPPWPVGRMNAASCAFEPRAPQAFSCCTDHSRKNRLKRRFGSAGFCVVAAVARSRTIAEQHLLKGLKIGIEALLQPLYQY